jgi:hypothetical protein
MFTAAVRRAQNLVAFRRARRMADAHFAATLWVWDRLARRHGLTFAPAAPLGSSTLRGWYEGLDVRIRLAFEEIRVVTLLNMSLPGTPPAGLLERLASLRYEHQRRDALLAEFAPHDTSGRLRATENLFLVSLNLSKESISCNARYLEKEEDYEAVLALMAAVARSLTATRGSSVSTPYRG